MQAKRAPADPAFWPDNVVGFRLTILPRHRALLAQWLAAGQCMGLCDADVFTAEDDAARTGYALVWVRENADPAYMIAPEGNRWSVVDQVREQVLARFPRFEDALNFIRPVLPGSAAA